MKTMLVGALLWGAVVSSTQAMILTASGDPLANGSITVDPPNLNEVNVVSVFTAVNDSAAMLLTMEVDVPGLYAITETITNDSGVDWHGFNWLMSNAEGVFFFDFLDPPGSGPFPASAPNADAATSIASVFGGVLQPGQSMDVNLQVLVTGVPAELGFLGFTIVHVPSSIATVPLPASAVLLGLGGIPALFAIGRTRRA